MSIPLHNILFVNNYGRRFLDLCKHINICIVNGRSGSDKDIGKTTCNGKSVVDYIACTPNLFSSIHDFDILPFCGVVSDKHYGVEMRLSTINSTIKSDVNVPNDYNSHSVCPLLLIRYISMMLAKNTSVFERSATDCGMLKILKPRIRKIIIR